MSIRRLKTLIAIAEEGTFAAAAHEVHLSQAAVSMQMKSLEEELGVTIFDRTKRPPELNPMGQALIPKARDIVRGYDMLVQSLRGEDTFNGELILGVLPTCLAGLAPKAIRYLRKSYPNLRLHIVPGLSNDLMQQVERGFLDTAIVSEPMRPLPHLDWSPFVEEPLVVLASQETESDDPMRLLREMPFIRFSRQAWVGRQIDEWLQKQNIRVRESMELDSLDAIATMVHHNLGVSIVPLRCVPEPNPLPLKRLSLGLGLRPRILGLLTLRDSPKMHLVDVVHRILEEIATNPVCEKRARR